MNLRRKLALAWVLLILVACWVPSSWLPQSNITLSGPSWFDLPKDKLAHACLFGGFAVTWWMALPPRRRPLRILLGGLFLIALTEWVQSLSFIAREGDLLDAAADSVGLLVALGVCLALERFAWAPPARPPAAAASGPHTHGIEIEAARPAVRQGA